MVALLAILAVGVVFYELLRNVRTDEQAPRSKASASDLTTKLIGTWTLEAASNPGSPSGIGTRLKFFTGTHWCVVQPDPDTGVIVFQHGGRYVLDGNKMRATTDFAGQLTKSLIGRTATFTIQIDADTCRQVDPNGKFNETWKRVN